MQWMGQQPLAGCWGLGTRGRVCQSGEEPEAAQVVCSPACLILHYAIEHFEGEGLAGVMASPGHAPAIGVTMPRSGIPSGR
jgi:hypothetical protein